MNINHAQGVTIKHTNQELMSASYANSRYLVPILNMTVAAVGQLLMMF